MSKHAVALIKKDNKYLQYYDNRWDSYLFVNYKMLDNFKDNDLKKYIDTLLMTNCEVKYITDIVHTKYSVSHKTMKEYHHYFYSVNCNINSNNFKINDIEYKWFTMEELKNNKRIMEVNSDIVSIVENLRDL